MVAFRSVTEIQKIVNKIRSISGIKNVDVTLTMDLEFPIKIEYSNIKLF
jgi:hypothetical protein